MSLPPWHSFVKHPERFLFNIDTLAYVVSILSLIFTLDQMKIIWIDHNASGVALLSWTVYTIAAGVWFVYGRVHKDKVITITNFLWVVFALTIVIGVLLFR